MTEATRNYYLKSLSDKNQKILITNELKFIGRSPETRITDPCCSRKQLCLKANLKDNYVLLKVVGPNATALNGFVLPPHEPFEAQHGDIIELIHNRFLFEVVFDPPPDATSTNGEGKTAVKRKSSNSNDESMDKSQKRVKESKDPDFEPNKTSKWEKIDGGKLYVFTSEGVKSSPKIAAYDMDGTLIKTKSGNVFPKDINDWELNYGDIPKKLNALLSDGYKIVILTNQAAISKGKLKIEDFKLKIEKVVKQLKVPVQVFIAPGTNYYRKPLIGMWESLCKDKNDGIAVRLDDSLYVGDAAGRPEIKTPVKRKKDHSMADRLMAINVGLPFYTPEEHFLKQKTMEWIKPEFNPKDLDASIPLVEPSDAKIKPSDTEVIIMVGIPGSGKSHFTRTYLEKNGYIIVNRDKLGTWQKCVARMEQELALKHSVVIDNTNPDIESRKRYIDSAKKLKVKIRCFVMSTTYKHARHNNLFREITDSSHTKINDMVFNSFKSKYQEPKLDEGFNEIVKVNIVPKFKDEKLEKLYHLYLLDK